MKLEERSEEISQKTTEVKKAKHGREFRAKWVST
jgi:hypothetical protein